MHSILLAVCCLLGGNVHSSTGAPIANARIALRGSTVFHTTTNARGTFAIAIPAGAYEFNAQARGYAGATVDLRVQRDSQIDVALEAVDAPTLRTIAAVRIDGRLAPMHGTIPSVTLPRAEYERMGYDRVVDAIAGVPSVTFSRPDGGGSNAIAAISLRGPDPSETLIALDGQLLNDANTGDIDVSRFPIAAFSSVDITEGLGPQDSEGSNTIGGAVDLVSLRPTREAHDAFSLSTGSFGAAEGWYNATGSRGRLGYAVAADDQQTAGYVNQQQTIYVPGDPAAVAGEHLGSNVAARSALANAVWTFSQNADLGLRFFTLADLRDQSSSVNGVDANAGSATKGSFVGPGDQTFAQNVRAYQVHGRAPLGSGDFIGEFSASNDSVGLAGGVASATYDLTHRDRRTTESVAWGRTFERSEYEVGGYLRHEDFAFVDPAGGVPTLAQNVSSYFVRGGYQASAKLHVSAAAFASRYSSFGSNLDGRIGVTYQSSPSTTLRASAGTGFRAPLLIERYVFPPDQLPPPDANCVVAGQGNPNERPEHATEYEAGVSHQFSSSATMDVSLYRTNLRDAIENYYPLANACPTIAYSYPINVGNVVYQGAELRFVQRFTPQHLVLSANYGLNVAYPTNLSAAVSNPTSGANLVNGEQFLGIPQQQGSIGLDYAEHAWHASARATLRGNNNELHQSPYTVIDASVGMQLRSGVDLALAATNVFNSAAGRYTVFGGGQPYQGLVSTPEGTTVPGALPTNRYALDPASIRLVLTVRH